MTQHNQELLFVVIILIILFGTIVYWVSRRRDEDFSQLFLSINSYPKPKDYDIHLDRDMFYRTPFDYYELDSFDPSQCAKYCDMNYCTGWELRDSGRSNICHLFNDNTINPDTNLIRKLNSISGIWKGATEK